MAKQSNPDFLNGVPELVALELLSRRPMYGYELVKDVERSSGNVLEFGEGCIYPILHRLEQDDVHQRIGDPTRSAVLAAEQYHARSFWGRHPVVTYALGPLPTLVLMWVLYLSAVLIPLYSIGTFGEWMGWWRQGTDEFVL